MDNTRGYARVSHSRQWSNCNLYGKPALLHEKHSHCVGYAEKLSIVTSTVFFCAWQGPHALPLWLLCCCCCCCRMYIDLNRFSIFWTLKSFLSPETPARGRVVISRHVGQGNLPVYTCIQSTFLLSELIRRFHGNQRERPASVPHIVQESWATAKMTARCALYMGALEILETPWVRPRLLFPKF